MAEIKVNTQHPSYQRQQMKRDAFAAVYSTDTLRDCGKTYLPMYPAEDERDYATRLNSSTIDGLVTNGVDTLCGAVFHDDIDVSGVDASIQQHLENIDNEGNHFNVFVRRAFESSFDGFSVIVVDAPAVEPGMVKSLADQNTLGIRPYWRLYKAADVINWAYEVDPVSKQTRLAMIVLHEAGEDMVERFGRKVVKRYRVLFRDGGTVKWELWRKVEEKKEQFVLEAAGVFDRLSEIPVANIGKFEDDPKLLVESRLEIKGYQKESSFDQIEYLSVPTFYTKGYEGEDKIALGAAAHVKLPLEGDIGYAQIDAAGHDSLKATIREIKDTIKSKVSMLVESAVEKTATEAAIQDTDKQARLIVWAEELQDAIEKALMYHAQLMGQKAGGEIQLATKWQAAKEAQEAMTQAMAAGAGKGNDEGGNN